MIISIRLVASCWFLSLHPSKVSLLFVKIWICFEEEIRIGNVGEETARKVFGIKVKAVKQDRIKFIIKLSEQ